MILATAECYRRRIEALGLGFRAVRPDCTWLADPEMVRPTFQEARAHYPIILLTRRVWKPGRGRLPLDFSFFLVSLVVHSR